MRAPLEIEPQACDRLRRSLQAAESVRASGTGGEASLRRGVVASPALKIEPIMARMNGTVEVEVSNFWYSIRPGSTGSGEEARAGGS